MTASSQRIMKQSSPKNLGSAKLRESGIDAVGRVPWGTHFCHFYQSGQDLIDVLVPYFKEGLLANEFCMWVTSAPLKVEEAKAALKRAVPKLDDHVEKGQIEVLDYTDVYLRSGKFNSQQVLDGWVTRLADVRKKGFEGMRLAGNTHWLEGSAWRDFEQYEQAVNDAFGKHRMIAVCSYSLEKCGAVELIDVVASHQFALIRRHGDWDLIESSHHKLTEDALRASEERFRSLFDSSNEGIALNEIVVDKSGREVDYRILDINRTFETITGIPVRGSSEHWPPNSTARGKPHILKPMPLWQRMGKPPASRLSLSQ